METFDWQGVRQRKFPKGKKCAKLQRPNEDDLLRVRAFLRETATNAFVAERDELIVDFMRIYCLRIGETLSLHLDGFNFRKERFTVFDIFEKNGKEKEFLLSDAPDWFRQKLSMYVQRNGSRLYRGGRFLFPSSYKSGHHYMRPDAWVEGRWKKAVHAAGLERTKLIARNGRRFITIHTHQLRALGITRLIEQGVPLRAVQAFTQHSNINTILRYYHLVEEEAARRTIMHDHISQLRESEAEW